MMPVASFNYVSLAMISLQPPSSELPIGFEALVAEVGSHILMLASEEQGQEKLVEAVPLRFGVKAEGSSGFGAQQTLPMHLPVSKA